MTNLRSLSARAQKRPLWRVSGQQKKGFSTSSRRYSYADTVPNLKIGAHTKVLFQGFTGEMDELITIEKAHRQYILT
jgi:succinyl-CoA synthetase alpha subunit